MGRWILYTQLNYVHPKPTHLTPLQLTDCTKRCGTLGPKVFYSSSLG